MTRRHSGAAGRQVKVRCATEFVFPFGIFGIETSSGELVGSSASITFRLLVAYSELDHRYVLLHGSWFPC